MRDYPEAITPPDHVQPVPRRLRAVLAGTTVVDTSAARYVWEWPPYPQYYVPLADVRPGLLVDEQRSRPSRRGTAHRHGLRVGETSRPDAADVYGEDAIEGVAGPEAANNASAAGMFVPLLALGLPVTATAAVLLAAMRTYGIVPGPTLMIDQPDLVAGELCHCRRGP